MSQGISLSRGGRAYVGGVVVAGAAVIGHSIFQLVNAPPEPYWLILVLLTLMSGPLSIRVPSTRAHDLGVGHLRVRLPGLVRPCGRRRDHRA